LEYASGQVTYKKFNAPGKKTTRMQYCLEELRLLCFVLRCFHNNSYISDSDYRTEAASSETASSDVTSSGDESDSVSSPDSSSSSQQQIASANKKTYCIVLTDSQTTAIQNLRDLLRTTKYNSKELQYSIDALTETLYMPSNTADMINDEFVSPVRAMCCLRAVSEQGGFIHPKGITSNLVGLQCGGRLCVYRVVQRMLQGDIKASGGDQWFR
jgi:hypothetical protein